MLGQCHGTPLRTYQNSATLQAEPSTCCAVIFMTHFADLSSWELAQKLVKKLPELQAR